MRSRHWQSWRVSVATSLCFFGAAPLAVADATPAPSPQNAEQASANVEIPASAYVTLMLARDPAVHAELGLKAKTVNAVQSAVAAVDHPLWLLRDVPVSTCADRLDALRSQLRGQLDAILSPEQAQRFDQLVIQARGSKCLAAPDVRQQLELSDEQASQLKQLVVEAKQGTLDTQKVMALLSPKQQAALGTLFGKPFNLAKISQISTAAPELRGVNAWINSQPLSLEKLRGKVVVLHFWAFNCGNCVNNLPHYQAWFKKFPAAEVAIVGIHTPETSAERDVDNLKANVKQREIAYPVAVDGAAENWKAWGNNVWPAVYLIDRHGYVRSWWYGELNWQGAKGEETMRQRIEHLVLEK